MARKLSFFVSLILCSFNFLVATAQEKYNLDIEQVSENKQVPIGWGLGNVMSTTGQPLAGFGLDEKEKHGGKFSLLIDWSENWTATNYVIKKSFKGQKIILKGYLKTENAEGWAGLWMRLDGENGRNLGFDNMHDRPVKGTTDWKEYTIELDYDGQEVKQIVVGALIIGKGKVWMDDLSITFDGKEIDQAPLLTPVVSKAALDTAYNKGSGLSAIALNKDGVRNLTNLGMLWGFVKYYHDGVRKGDFNMDAELFRVLPKVVDAGNVVDANHIMELWLDGFGKHPACEKCDHEINNKGNKLLPDYGNLFTKNNFPASLVAKLEYIKNNRTKVEKHYYNDPSPGVANPGFAHERAYDETVYPDAGTRLLGLYRYWNMVQYFFPDRHLIGENWNNVLEECIAEFLNAKDETEYQVAFLKLIGRVHDTHANLWGGAKQIEKMKGNRASPFQAKFIENKLVVTDYYADTLGIKNLVKPGDIVEKINGVPVDELIKKYLPLTPASNYETQLRDIRSWLLRTGKVISEFSITHDGQRAEVSIPTIPLDMKMRMYEYDGNHVKGYSLLADRIGYIYPGKLENSDLDTVKKLFSNTCGIVIDMRCYPTAWMPFVYADWFKSKSSPFVAFTRGSLTNPGLFKLEPGEPNGKKNKNNYKGKVVIIVNEKTQSQAEYVTMALASSPNVTVIGSTTAGADGNVSDILLPGGLTTMFSGIGILYPDGTESQRKGVKIDKIVTPTIKGIKEGRDELMEAAIKIIKSEKRQGF